MRWLVRLIDGIILSICACVFVIISYVEGTFWKIIYTLVLIFLYFIVNLVPSIPNFRIKSIKCKTLADGVDLYASYAVATTVVAIFYMVFLLSGRAIADFRYLHIFFSIMISVMSLALVFFNATLKVGVMSKQVELPQKIIGVMWGGIPFLNLPVLSFVVLIADEEVKFEYNKEKLNKKRRHKKICKTRYPILLVHGVFFRDFQNFNYWGRIPEELEANGAKIYYGNHQSALSIADSAKELTNRITQIVEDTGCGKVNIIAHSKGGLDCRYAISKCGMEKYVASLTTINTPHRGCVFADYLLNKIPLRTKKRVASTYNKAMTKLGDTNPDFMRAVVDLTYEKCAEFNKNVPDSNKVYCQSVGSKLNKARNGKFPWNLSYNFVKHFGGVNDGIVSETSFAWGCDYKLITTNGRRGVSHGDMTDLYRDNIPGFDVREFYVQLVNDLKQKGF